MPRSVTRISGIAAADVHAAPLAHILQLVPSWTSHAIKRRPPGTCPAGSGRASRCGCVSAAYRLLVRADSALTAGHKDEVAEALDEVRHLAPGIERLASIEQAMGAPPSPQEETDVLIVTDGSTIETVAESESSAGTSSGAAKLALAAGSMLVAAAGLIAWSIYTTPAEQLRALFPSLGDVRLSPPAPPDPANARRAGPVVLNLSHHRRA